MATGQGLAPRLIGDGRSYWPDPSSKYNQEAQRYQTRQNMSTILQGMNDLNVLVQNDLIVCKQWNR